VELDGVELEGILPVTKIGPVGRRDGVSAYRLGRLRRKESAGTGFGRPVDPGQGALPSHARSSNVDARRPFPAARSRVTRWA
jgi:hypothetical protein